MASTWRRLWLVAILDLFAVGCFLAGAAAPGAGASGAYVRGFVAMPAIAIVLDAARRPPG